MGGDLSLLVEWALQHVEIAVALLFLLVFVALLGLFGPWRPRVRLRILLATIAVVACGAVATYFVLHYVPEASASLLRANSTDLKRTVVVTTDDVPIGDGTNVLWCASFQLAWDALKRDVLKGEPVALGPPARPAEVRALDEGAFPPSDLDPASFVAMAGGPGTAGRFAEAVRRRFDEDVDMPEPHPNEVVAAAFLLKNLPFEHPFETFENGIRFAGSTRTVRAFGMNPHSDNPRKPAILAQVRIHFAESDANPDNPLLPPDRFVIEVLVGGGRDRLLLARIDPSPTLRETWEKVRLATQGEGKAARSNTILGIPKLNFDIRHRFTELEGAAIASIAGSSLSCAMQRTRFRLDETGALLRSDAAMRATLGISPYYVFDRPFLVALVQKGATRPYLLLWIGNDELLTPE